LLEFAFALPFLLLMFAGVAELGRMFYTYTTLAKATRAGARYASTTASPVDTDLGAIRNIVVCGEAAGCSGVTPVVADLGTGDVAVTKTGVATQYVKVTITYNYRPLIFDLQAMTGSTSISLNKTFTPSTTMRYMD